MKTDTIYGLNFSRASLFARLPETQDEAIELLRRFDSAGLAWHLDDDPKEIENVEAPHVRCFSDAECIFCESLVDRLNALWPDAGDCINAGAWEAVACAEWLSPDCVTDEERSNGPRR